jgi:hypothetical protein
MTTGCAAPLPAQASKHASGMQVLMAISENHE